MGTTVRVASIRDDGHTFHDSRTPIPVSVTRILGFDDKLTIALLYVFDVEHFIETRPD